MEDRYQILQQPENSNIVLLAGVYDGHRGEVSLSLSRLSFSVLILRRDSLTDGNFL